MRKHLYLITEHSDDDHIGLVEVKERRHARVEKNSEGVVETFNIETGERREYRCVGLGYYDFDDESDYQENAADVLHEKLVEVDTQWHEKAGVQPEVLV